MSDRHDVDPDLEVVALDGEHDRAATPSRRVRLAGAALEARG
jgi:hypothetical protein